MKKPLFAEKLFKNPKIAQAKKLLSEAIDEAQSDLNQLQPADSERTVDYEKILKAFAQARGGALYYPYVGSGIGKGALVELLDGSVKYDFICGIGPHYFGHSHPKLVDAAIDSAISNTIMQGHLQQNIEPLHLMEKLIELSSMDHCFLTSSGAMATENALKLAFHNKTGASRVLAFDHCFMGRTITLSQITDKPAFRVGLPTTLPVDYVPFYDPKEPKKSTVLSVKTLKKHLTRYPNQHGAMCFELIQGEGGFNVGTKSFFHELMNTLKEHDIPIIVDEVQTFSRTPDMFAYHHFELQNFVDIVCIGKLSQVCATLFKNRMKPTPGLLSQTFTASSSAIKAALTILDDLSQGNYFGPDGKIAKTHMLCTKKLESIAKKHPELIRGPYGVGSMIAFTPLEGEPQQAVAFAKELFKSGVITFVAGSNPTRIRMLIPVPSITPEDIDAAFKILEETLVTFKETVKKVW